MSLPGTPDRQGGNQRKRLVAAAAAGEAVAVEVVEEVAATEEAVVQGASCLRSRRGPEQFEHLWRLRARRTRLSFVKQSHVISKRLGVWHPRIYVHPPLVFLAFTCAANTPRARHIASFKKLVSQSAGAARHRRFRVLCWTPGFALSFHGHNVMRSPYEHAYSLSFVLVLLFFLLQLRASSFDGHDEVGRVAHQSEHGTSRSPQAHV